MGIWRDLKFPQVRLQRNSQIKIFRGKNFPQNPREPPLREISRNLIFAKKRGLKKKRVLPKEIRTFKKVKTKGMLK